MADIVLDGITLTPIDLQAIATGATLALAPDALQRMEESAAWLLRNGPPKTLREKWPWLSSDEAPRSEAECIKAFIVGHCAGVGRPFPKHVVRATMAARINVLATGHTGCRPQVATTLIAMLNADIVPIVPSQGSVGAGDLAPLAHIVEVAAGFGGHAWRDGQVLPFDKAMQGHQKLDLNEKEGLSLINGSSLTAALGALTCNLARQLLITAERACALSFEVVRADLGCLSIAALSTRNHPGPIRVAKRLGQQLEGSELVGEGREPDPYSIRCAPSVLGAAWDALDYVTKVITRELNACSDNPIVFVGSEPIEGGNFHGAPLGLALDHLKIALTQAASMSERRIFRMTYGQLSGLPSFLVKDTGLNSGLMLAQYTAASLVSECKGLAHPACVDSIPTVQHHEDHVSMSPISARGAWLITQAFADILSIELLCAAQGLDFHLSGESSGAPLKAGKGTMQTFEHVRRRVKHWTDDRVLHTDIDSLGQAIRQGVYAT